MKDRFGANATNGGDIMMGLRQDPGSTFLFERMDPRVREHCLDLLFGASLPLHRVCHAFAYGSGVIPQEGEDPRQKMIDFLLVCNNSALFHRENLILNPAHYSFLFRRMCNLDKHLYPFQRYFGASLFYNTMVPSRGRLIKYGVIDAEDLETDLLDWEWLYAAGRLHKPVVDVFGGWPNEFGLGERAKRQIGRAVLDNRRIAMHTALLQLPSKFAIEELLIRIVSLSYKGDLRMGWAEDARKAQKLVSGAGDKLVQIYKPILDEDRHVNCLSAVNIEHDCSTPVVFHRLNMLPRTVLEGMRKSYYPFARARDTEELLYPISHRHDLADRLDTVLADIVRRSSWRQTVKNFWTAGVHKSIAYGLPKLKKGLPKIFGAIGSVALST